MNNLKNTILIILTIISFLCTMSGLSGLEYVKLNNCKVVSISCDNCTFMNISSYTDKDDLFYLVNKPMTNLNGYYNYSFCNNTKLGLNTIKYCGDPDSLLLCNDYLLKVTPTGEELDNSKAIVYIVMIIGLFFILFLTFYGALVFPWKNNRDEEGNIISINDLKYLKVVLWVFVYLEVLFIVMILKNLSGFLISDGSYQFFNLIFWLLLIGLIPMFPLLIFFTIIIWISDKKTEKKIIRGFKLK